MSNLEWIYEVKKEGVTFNILCETYDVQFLVFRSRINVIHTDLVCSFNPISHTKICMKWNYHEGYYLVGHDAVYPGGLLPIALE
jgi:hypothetical protein